MSSTDFNQRLERAIQRGRSTRTARGREEELRQLTLDEQRQLHAECRLELSEHIAACLRKLADHFPGFDHKHLAGEDGWGARISRDDLSIQPGKGTSSLYSRLELLVSPLGSAPIVELVAKGTIRNREVFHRRHFQRLEELDRESFRELIDLWVLEYAEQYSAAG